MTKPKNPLFSFDARGSLTKLLTFRRRGQQSIAESIPTHPDAQTSAQLSWRTMYQKCRDLWHTLSQAEKQTWESLARRQHMTGYAYYMSQCLRPNPGIYLPLAGGTMSGNINMATNKILNLPLPLANEEPTRKGDFLPFVSGWTANKLLKGAGAGVAPTEISSWQAIAEVIPGSNVTYVDFASLDINTDKFYLLFMALKNPLANPVAYCIFVNGDITSTHYYQQYGYASGVTFTCGRENNPAFTYIGAGATSFPTITITRDPDGYFRATTLYTRDPAAFVIWEARGICKTATVTNITSVVILASSANGIGAGSTLLLCKPRSA